MKHAKTEHDSILTPLAWDTRYFGFPVAKISAATLDDKALHQALMRSRSEGLRLVYWAAAPDCYAPDSLLRAFTGLQVDRKTTYRLDLATRHTAEPPCQLSDFQVAPYPRGPASESLIALGIAAGRHSRFRVDPRIEQERFEGLYTIWVQQSARRQLADTILVVQPLAAPGVLAGMVTIRAMEGTGQIGLIAVSKEFRSRGLGSFLVESAHRWMVERGLSQAAVVTQLDNASACRLYERCGYRQESVQNYYHFWVQEADQAESRLREAA